MVYELVRRLGVPNGLLLEDWRKLLPNSWAFKSYKYLHPTLIDEVRYISQAEVPLGVVDLLADEEAHPGRFSLFHGGIAQVEEVFMWVVCRVTEGFFHGS